MDKDTIWEKICQHAGETFYTKTGLPLIYEIRGETLYHNRTATGIPRSQFEKAAAINPKTVSDLHSAVKGPAYVFAIITDKKMQ